MRLRLTKNGKTVASRDIPCTIEALGSTSLSAVLPVPSKPGDYVLTAELRARGDKPIRSVRDAKVVEAQ